MQYYTLYFAQAYGEGAYGASKYSCTQEQVDAGTCVAGSSTGSGGGSGSGSGLADTGVGIVALVTLACLIVFISLVVRIWRRPRPVPEEVQTFSPVSEQDDTSRSPDA